MVGVVTVGVIHQYLFNIKIMVGKLPLEIFRCFFGSVAVV